MRRFNFLQAIFMAFYSKELYRDVAKNWGGGVLVYLLLVLTLCWAAMMLVIQPLINEGALKLSRDIAPQLPNKLIIKDGILITPEKRPYVIKDPETKDIIAIIDTRGKYSVDDLANVPFFITQDSIIYKSKNTIKIQKVPKDTFLEITPGGLQEVIAKFAHWLGLILFPIFLMTSFLYRLIQGVLYAILGKFFSHLMRVSLLYEEVLKLTLVAITPSIIIGTILDWNHIAFHWQWLFYFILSMGYLIFAIRANKPEEY